MDVVSLFSAVVFALAWICLSRAEPGEPLARLFFKTLMVLAIVIGGLGLLLRAMS